MAAGYQRHRTSNIGAALDAARKDRLAAPGASTDTGEVQKTYAAPRWLKFESAPTGDEIVQFASTSLIRPGEYALFSFLRGRRGTDVYRSAHESSERFVLLSSAVRSNVVDSADQGNLRYYKVARTGQKLSSVITQTFTPTGDVAPR